MLTQLGALPGVGGSNEDLARFLELLERLQGDPVTLVHLRVILSIRMIQFLEIDESLLELAHLAPHCFQCIHDL